MTFVSSLYLNDDDDRMSALTWELNCKVDQVGQNIVVWHGFNFSPNSNSLVEKKLYIYKIEGGLQTFQQQTDKQLNKLNILKT